MRPVGPSFGDIASASAVILSGGAATAVRDVDRLVDVVLRGEGVERTDLTTAANLTLVH